VATVRVTPWDITFEVAPGESVFDASFRAGWLWPTTCYGQAQCTRCHMKVLSNAAELSPPDDVELAIIQRLRRTSHRRDPDAELRLACQVRPQRDLTVELRNAPVLRTS
jgi:2Fe-2S ferredoxin